MDTSEAKPMTRMPNRPLFAVLFCVGGLVLNLVGSQLATALGLPVYLDCLGTVLTAAFAGYIPGIAVGYFTNILNSTASLDNLYYGVISVLIAAEVAFFARRGWLEKMRGVLGLIVVLAFTGGVLGSLLTWSLYSFEFGNGVSAGLAQQLYGTGVIGMFGAQIIADFALDLLDKTIVVTVAIIVIRLLPDRFAGLFDFNPWRQMPLTSEEMHKVEGVKTRGAALRVKVAVLVGAVMIIVAVVTTAISFIQYHQENIETQAENAVGITQLAAKEIDADRVDDYLRYGEAAPGYRETEAQLEKVRDSFNGLEYVYVYRILEDGCHVVFDLDTAELEGAEPGEVVPFDESFAEYLPALLAGEPIEPIVTNDTYGWLLTVYTPLYDSQGNCSCYVAVDIEMGDLLAEEAKFLARVIALFLAFFLVVCAVSLWLVRYNIVLPVNSIALATSNFALGHRERRRGSVKYIQQLDIRTGDEVENLYKAIAKTSDDMVRYIAEAQERSQTIDRMQSNLIMVMADLVESRDKYTGNHIKNTTAYVKILLHKMKEKGVYADQLTDEFISDTTRSAPLHDIGKIAVSDAILNKPGRLTDEEFEIMKSHTTVGREILRSAVGAVSESSYLDEAQNLAAYHHEKWNGKGYPEGLAGYDIPLSARVMAVADVFDALVSKRSYKDGFPLPKAFDIIREGMGTHFDPEIAAVFLECEDEVRVIAEAQGADGLGRADDDFVDGHADRKDSPDAPGAAPADAPGKEGTAPVEEEPEE